MALQEHVRAPALTAVLAPVSRLGDKGLFWIALTILLLLFKKTRRAGLASACALLLSLIVTNFCLKPLIDRIRPYDLVDQIALLVPKEHDASFPSGHASASFASAFAIFRTSRKRLGGPALALAALIALSRPYVGVHYPTDVLAGILVGLLVGECAVRLTRRAFNRRDRLEGYDEKA